MQTKLKQQIKQFGCKQNDTPPLPDWWGSEVTGSPVQAHTILSMGLGPDDVGLGAMPLHHVGGIACNLFTPLVCGGGMVHLEDSFEAGPWFDALEGRGGGADVVLHGARDVGHGPGRGQVGAGPR